MISTSGLQSEPARSSARLDFWRCALRGIRGLSAALLACVALSGCGSNGTEHSDTAAADSHAAPRAEFPLLTSRNGRYLTDSKGVPFPILGRASWAVLTLQPRDFERYLDDTRDKGFDAVELAAPPHEGNHVPLDGFGHPPFLRRLDGHTWDGSLRYRSVLPQAPDFTSPNEAYWAQVDSFLDACAARGIVVLLFPSYVGYKGTDQGWMSEMLANGPERMRTYGAWIASRYKSRKNIIWMLGGDRGTAAFPFLPEELLVERALVSGLTGGAGAAGQQRSAEWSGPLATSEPDFESLITLDGAYASAARALAAAFSRAAYSHVPVRPAFLLEEPYDEEGPDGNGRNLNATQPVRRFEWWGWLNSIGGYVAGNGFVWQFRDAWWRLRSSYRGHLDTPNTHDLAHLNRLIRSLPWYELVPDGLGNIGTLVTDGRGSPDALDYVAAAATPDGRLLVAYAGPASRAPFTLDLTKMRTAATARWFNPTTGEWLPIGSFRNDHAQSFSVPGDNGAGARDWALILTSP
jgi:hypothetical protein